MDSERLPFVHRKVNRHGKEYLFYVRMGVREALPGPENSEAFLRRYRDLEAQFNEGNPAETVGFAIEEYYKSAKFNDLSGGSRREYRRSLDNVREQLGEFKVKLINDSFLESLRMQFKGKPAQWNTLRSRMKAVWKNYKRKYPAYVSDNPWEDSDRMKEPKSDQNRPWPMSVYQQISMEATPQFRKLLATLLLTAQRIGDVCEFRVDRYDPATKIISFEQEKTGRSMQLEVTDTLYELWFPVRLDQVYFLETPRGKQWTVQNAEETLLGIRARLGLPRYVLHGLRATGPTLLKLAEFENRTVRELTGHTSDRNFELYVRGAGGIGAVRRSQRHLDETLGSIVMDTVERGNQKKESGVTGKLAAKLREQTETIESDTLLTPSNFTEK